MANQMIALQTRNPQLPDPSKMTAQYATMMNLAQQNETSKRQAAQAQQQMDFAAAKEGREKEMQPFAVGKAKNEAFSAQQKAVLDFMEVSYETIKRARSPEDVVNAAGRLKQNFPDPVFTDLIDQTVATLPADPSQFSAWKQQSEFDTLSNVQRLEQVFKTQNTGTEQREIAMPKYGGGAAVEVPGSRFSAAQGKKFIRDANGAVYSVDDKTGGGFDTPAPAVGTPGGGSRGAPGQGNTADVVYGFGKFGSPAKPISQSTIGEVQKFQRDTLIPNTKGRVGAGADKGTGAVGTYQFTYGTLKEYAPKVLGPNWRDTPFTADVQEQLAKALYEDVKGGDLKKTWAGLPSNRPGQYTNVPWENVRDKIIKVESAGGGNRRTSTGATGAGTGTGTGTDAGTGKPQTISDFNQQKAFKKTLQMVNYDAKTGFEIVSDLIKSSTSGGAERIGSDVVGFVTGKATPGRVALGQLATLKDSMTFEKLRGKLGAQISDADVRLVANTMGDIANVDIPWNERLAKWQNIVLPILVRGAGLTYVKPKGGGGAPKTSTKKPPLKDIFR